MFLLKRYRNAVRIYRCYYNCSQLLRAGEKVNLLGIFEAFYHRYVLPTDKAY